MGTHTLPIEISEETLGPSLPGDLTNQVRLPWRPQKSSPTTLGPRKSSATTLEISEETLGPSLPGDLTNQVQLPG